MGKIERASGLHFGPPRRSVLLVGQAPGADGDPRPLTGTMGKRLGELAGLHLAKDALSAAGLPRDEFIGTLFDRANVLDYYPGRLAESKGDQFPLAHARTAAAFMWPAIAEHYDRTLFCGKAVWDVFRTCQAGLDVSERRREWMSVQALEWVDGRRYGIHGEVAWMPHTSGIVTWWNDVQNRLRAESFMACLTVYALGRTAAA